MNVVITGASKGIGFATAIALCKDDNQVFAIARSGNRLEELRKVCELQRGRIVPIEFDVTSCENDFNTKLLPSIAEKCQSVDVLINNAGSLLKRKFEDIEEVEWKEMLEVNLLGPMKLIKTLMPLLARSKRAHVINIGSMGGFQSSVKFPGLTAYSASKSALAGFTECLAEELRSQGLNISVNCLCPGTVQTDMQAKAFPNCEGRIVTAEEMGEFIAQFAVNGGIINGKVIPVAATTP